MTFCDCAFCGDPIADAADAVMVDETPPGESDAGRVRYRHPDCSEADAPRDLSTYIEM